MDDLLVLREKIQKLYSRHSMYIDKGIRFMVALLTFWLINQNVGLMKPLTQPLVILGISVVCAFLSPVFTVLVAGAFLLAHFSTLSIGIAGISAIIFFMMFIFYCRFTPKNAIYILLVPIGFFLKIPYMVPVIAGLLMTPVTAIPIAFGTFIYYMVKCVKDSASAITAADGITSQVMIFLKAVFQNKEVWIMAIAFAICVCVVYVVRRMSIDHAWKIATASGAVVNIVIAVLGDVIFDVHISYVGLILGNAVAILAGLILEIFFFSLDYARTERLQYEDDEYYYYVKAVPKLTMAAPEKTVKRINKRVEPKVIDRAADSNEKKPVPKKRPVKKSPNPARSKSIDKADEILLEKKLREELEIQNLVNSEMKKH